MEAINLIHGDCLEEMKNIPDKSIDMVLTDPPYLTETVEGGIFKSRKYGQEIKDLNIHKGFPIVTFLELIKLKFKTKDHFNLVVFCSRRQIRDYIEYADLNNFQYGLTIWHKSNPIPTCNNTYLSDIEFAMYIKGKASRIFGSYRSKSLVYKSSNNQKEKKLYKHPTIKPIQLLEKYLINHTNENDTVLDPFAGTASTGIACKNLNRKFIGIEKDETYFKIAKKRITDYLKDENSGIGIRSTTRW